MINLTLSQAFGLAWLLIWKISAWKNNKKRKKEERRNCQLQMNINQTVGWLHSKCSQIAWFAISVLQQQQHQHLRGTPVAAFPGCWHDLSVLRVLHLAADLTLYLRCANNSHFCCKSRLFATAHKIIAWHFYLPFYCLPSIVLPDNVYCFVIKFFGQAATTSLAACLAMWQSHCPAH